MPAPHAPFGSTALGPQFGGPSASSWPGPAVGGRSWPEPADGGGSAGTAVAGGWSAGNGGRPDTDPPVAPRTAAFGAGPMAPQAGPMAPQAGPVVPQAGPVVPQQRGQGTVYGRTGGHPAVDMTMPVSHPLENSGSLTGHILAQGWHDTPDAGNNGNTKVVVIMLLVILGLIGMSVLFLVTAGDAVSGLFKGLLGG